MHLSENAVQYVTSDELRELYEERCKEVFRLRAQIQTERMVDYMDNNEREKVIMIKITCESCDKEENITEYKCVSCLALKEIEIVMNDEDYRCRNKSYQSGYLNAMHNLACRFGLRYEFESLERKLND